MTPKRRTISDAAALKALAHPLRMDLLEALVLGGPQTATELAARLDESPSNCSWHLRKLAEHGFVTEAPGAAGRSRPWEAASEGLTWGEGELEVETSAAGNRLTDVFLSREVSRLRAYLETQHQESPEWRQATTVSQSALWLTAEEAKEISSRMHELFLTHFDRLHHPDRRPEGARLVSLVGWLVPRLEPGVAPAAATDDETTDETTDGTTDGITEG